MKRRLSKLLIVLFCSLTAIGLFACDNSENDSSESSVENSDFHTQACVHVYGEWTVEQEADCSSIGLKYRVCNQCKNQEYEVIPSTEHKCEEVLNCLENYHSMLCESCHQAIFYSHTYPEQWTIEEGAHYKECICGKKSEITAHTYGEWKPNGELHCKECVCGASLEAQHEYNQWQYKSDTHWKECACGAKTEEGGHSYGEWYYNDRVHWRECVCGAKTEEEEHNLDEDNVCSVCNRISFRFRLSADKSYYIVDKLLAPYPADVIIPNAYNGLPIKEIGAFALDYCEQLTSVTIPDSVTMFWSSPFSECYKLTRIIVDENNARYKSVDGILYSKDGATLMRYPSGKTETEFIIPDSVTMVQEGALNDCVYLANIVVSENNESYKSIDGNLYSKDEKTLIQYAVGKAETEFAIPEDVTRALGGAFLGSRLTRITIPDGLTELGLIWECSFSDIIVGEGNANYQSIDGNLYSKDGKTLIRYASGKTETEFIVPDGVLTIGETAFYTFYGGGSLTSVTIPDSVTTIDWSALVYYENLQRVIFKNPNGWEVEGTEILATDLSDAEKAAEYLKSGLYWGNWVRADG